jgi:hypothetical protein
MLRRLARFTVLSTAVLAAAAPVRAQLLTGGVAPAFPIGDFKDLLDPGTGFLLSARLNLPLFPLVQLQAELTRVQGFELAGGDEGPVDLGLTTGGANLALHFIRVALVRPYVLAGVLGARESRTDALTDDSSWRFGYQSGVGLDFSLGPLTPFAELRWVSLDGPGAVRYTYVPVVIGLKIL